MALVESFFSGLHKHIQAVMDNDTGKALTHGFSHCAKGTSVRGLRVNQRPTRRCQGAPPIVVTCCPDGKSQRRAEDHQRRLRRRCNAAGDEESDAAGQAADLPRLPAQTALPQDITFKAPAGTAAGELVKVPGPLGPVELPLPKCAVAGQPCTVRFGPPSQYVVTVPEGAEPGTVVRYSNHHGEELQASVPEGKRPGDSFEVSLPPVLMVLVPEGAVAGQELVCTTYCSEPLIVEVPEGLSAGDYFQARYNPGGRLLRASKTARAQDLHFTVPEDGKPGQRIEVEGPHGPVEVLLPEDVQPGQPATARLGPPECVFVEVPDGAVSGGEIVCPIPSLGDWKATVPYNLRPGDLFEVSLPILMVQVPPGAQPGDQLCAETPDKELVFTSISEGCKPGDYLPVLLQSATKLQTEEENCLEDPELMALLGFDV